MICPTGCDTRLMMTERSGIEIDYCPTCRGVWLDRGELDRIIDRNAATQAPSQPTGPAGRDRPASPVRDDDDRARPDHHDTRQDQPTRKKKRGGFLEDLFEF